MTRLSVAEQQELLRINERAVDELAKLRARCERLRPYLRHKRDCRINPGGPIMAALGCPDPHPCTCGLTAALTAPEPEVVVKDSLTTEPCKVCSKVGGGGEVFDENGPNPLRTIPCPRCGGGA